MIIDSSALCAILLKEPGFEPYARAIAGAHSAFLSSVSFLETSMVLEAKRPGTGAEEVARFVRTFNIRITPFTEQEALAAVQAFLQFGKGRHSAGLNMGDCASYGASKVQGFRLLFKGNDFPQTDVDPVIGP
jgi:ribonuclease VapC